MLSKLPQKIKRNLIDYGLRITVTKSLEYLFSPIYRFRTYRLYRIDLATADQAPPFPDNSITVRLLNVDEVDLINQIESYAEFLQGDVCRTITNNGFCLIATQGEQLAGFNLISFGKIYMPLVKVNRVFRPDYAWSIHIAIFPDFRQQGLAAHLRYSVFDELRSRQFKWLYGGTLKSNIVSLKLAKRVGFLTFVDIEYSSILGWEFWRYRRVRDGNN